MKLVACGTLVGRLVDQDGKPLSEWSVSLKAEKFGSGTVTDNNGHFRFKGVPANIDVTLSRAADGKDSPVTVESIDVGKTVQLRPGRVRDLGPVKISIPQ